MINSYIGLGDKGNPESSQVKKYQFNLSLILTCNSYSKKFSPIQQDLQL